MYFDYKKRRPAAFDTYRNLITKEKKSSKNKNDKNHFFSCFSAKNSSNIKNHFIFSSEKINENENLMKKNNHFLLIKLWKLGIPSWVRKNLWPTVIGNRLEVKHCLFLKIYKSIIRSQKIYIIFY